MAVRATPAVDALWTQGITRARNSEHLYDRLAGVDDQIRPALVMATDFF
jgi:hypothetical protein